MHERMSEAVMKQQDVSRVRKSIVSYDHEKTMMRARVLEKMRQLETQIAILEENGESHQVPEELRSQLVVAQEELAGMLPEKRH